MRRPRLTYADVVATIAMFGVLTGGGAYAASKIGPKDISKSAIRAPHIAKQQVGAKHLRRAAVRAKHLKNGSVTAAKLAGGLTGARGPRGPRGTAGPAGPKGDRGEDGRDGEPAFQVDCREGLAPDDVMVRVGPTCIDAYEASLWDSPTGGGRLSDRAIDDACPENGQPTAQATCEDFYARSVPHVPPAGKVTWFQAQQALANSGKRLPSNAEWQAAVSGTPDSTACNISSGSISTTAARPGCVSRHGAFDMVGNVAEWVADWTEEGDGCGAWPSGYGSDASCLGAETPSRLPGALVRGGKVSDNYGTPVGPFSVFATSRPWESGLYFGFRGAR